MRNKFYLIVILCLCFSFACGSSSGNSNNSESSTTNRKPTITLQADKTSVSKKGTVNITASCADSDNDTLIVTWQVNSNGGSLNTTTGLAVTWIAPESIGTYVITATVNDGHGGSTKAEISISVTGGNSEKAKDYVIQARAHLINQEIKLANDDFVSALNEDGSNKDANFGASVTGLILLVEDPKVVDIISRWDEIPPKIDDIYNNTNKRKVTNSLKRALSIFKKNNKKSESVWEKIMPSSENSKELLKTIKSSIIPSGAPTVTEMQDVLEKTVLPKINTSIQYLQVVEQDVNYQFIVNKSMTGVESKEVDMGDIYSLDAALNGVSFFVNYLGSYNLDVNYSKIEQDPLSVFEDSKFFSLKTDGQTKMKLAYDNLKETEKKAKKAYDFIKQETDFQNDDVVTFIDWESPRDFDNANEFFTKFEEALTGPTVVTLEYDPSITEDDEKIKFDLAKFFDNPIDRTDLPPLGYDIPSDIDNRKVVRTGAFPDPTFNGLFPEITKAEINKYIGPYTVSAFLIPFDEISGDTITWRWISYNSFTSDGNNIWVIQYKYGYDSLNLSKSEYRIIKMDMNGNTKKNIKLPENTYYNSLTYDGSSLWTTRSSNNYNTTLISKLDTQGLPILNYKVKGTTWENRRLVWNNNYLYLAKRDDGIYKINPNSGSMNKEYTFNNINIYTGDSFYFVGNTIWLISEFDENNYNYSSSFLLYHINLYGNDILLKYYPFSISSDFYTDGTYFWYEKDEKVFKVKYEE